MVMQAQRGFENHAALTDLNVTSSVALYAHSLLTTEITTGIRKKKLRIHQQITLVFCTIIKFPTLFLHLNLYLIHLVPLFLFLSYAFPQSESWESADKTE